MATRKPPIRIVCPGPRVPRATRWTQPIRPFSIRSRAWWSIRASRMSDLKGTLDAFAQAPVRRRDRNPLPPLLLPLHRAERRGRPHLHLLPRQGLPHVQGHGLDRGAGLRHGQPQGADNVRHRSRTNTPALPSASAWSASPCCSYGIKDMRLLYESDERFLRQFR